MVLLFFNLGEGNDVHPCNVSNSSFVGWYRVAAVDVWQKQGPYSIPYFYDGN